MILVIGTLRGATAGPGHGPPAGGFRFVSLAELTPDLLAEVAPEMVLSELMGEGFDAIDLARTLRALGFRGPYRALTPPLPDPEAVRREVRGAAPGLDFDLVVTGGPLH